jgi:hypothetical protein
MKSVLGFFRSILRNTSLSCWSVGPVAGPPLHNRDIKAAYAALKEMEGK